MIKVTHQRCPICDNTKHQAADQYCVCGEDNEHHHCTVCGHVSWDGINIIVISRRRRIAMNAIAEFMALALQEENF